MHLSTDLSAICSEEIVFQKFKEAFEEGICTFKEPSFLWFSVINKSNPDAKDDHWMVWRNQHFFDCAASLFVRIYVHRNE